jgi:GGDEF domain-containing protein
MPTPREHARTLRHRARTWIGGTAPPPGPAHAPTPPTSPETVVAWATRELLRAESSEDVARIVANAVDVLGGRVVPASEADADALPLDVSFGVSEPMLPAADPGSEVRRRLERLLPALVADARHVNDNLIRAAHLRVDVATDPVTGLDTRATFTRALHRLRAADAVVVLRLTVPPPALGEDDRLEGAVRDFAALLQAQMGVDDHAARVEEDEFALLLHETGTAGTAVVVARLRTSWAQARPDVELHLGVAEFRESGVATLRDAYDELDRALAVAPAVPGEPVDAEGAPPAADVDSSDDTQDVAERTAP